WSAMSMEEIASIEQGMDINGTLKASDMGVNLCFQGIPEFSQIPMGTMIKFPSGAVLKVEEYNPPCKEMGVKLASIYNTNSGKKIKNADFSRHAKFCRGLVGVVEVAGTINAGDEVIVEFHKLPKWLARLTKN
ncbi:MAG: hypothetical protein GY829_05940, partial [Gammaproteobacteria bacterium]|nr:hypothetical protein [Gammaproteobacteria bacterium]